MRVAILTVSDGVSRGTRRDASGAVIREWADDRDYEIAERQVVPDDVDAIDRVLRAWCDGGVADLVITTGGTGLTPRDVTPEATRSVLEREAPGIAEAIRSAGAAETPYAWLSRGVAGTRGTTLIVNLPGSTGGVRDGLAVLSSLVDHALQLLRDENTERHEPHG